MLITKSQRYYIWQPVSIIARLRSPFMKRTSVFERIICFVVCIHIATYSIVCNVHTSHCLFTSSASPKNISKKICSEAHIDLTGSDIRFRLCSRLVRTEAEDGGWMSARSSTFLFFIHLVPEFIVYELRIGNVSPCTGFSICI